jgi:saccharopine dehydrogenase-like NADP-dependent oxidoreductase
MEAEVVHEMVEVVLMDCFTSSVGIQKGKWEKVARISVRNDKESSSLRFNSRYSTDNGELNSVEAQRIEERRVRGTGSQGLTMSL